MRRVLSIKFVRLPLDRRVRMGDPRIDGPFAIVSEIKNALRLTHLSPAAQQAGLTPGLSLPDARAICPQLLCEEDDKAREDLLLRALWRWADKLSPWVALDRPDGLFLDITGCQHLFGGEPQMAAFALEELSNMNITAKAGIADTKRAAWALARYVDRDITIAPVGQTANALAPLPLAGLNLNARTLTDLKRVGLKTIGDLYGKKTAELARRFGLELTKSLSFALGQAPDPVAPQAAVPVYAARMTLPEPIGRVDDLRSVLDKLATSVCTRLQTDHKGARRFDLIVRCVDTGDHHLSAGFARPTYAPGAILQQFTRPLEALKIEFGADWFRLVAAHIEPIKPRQLIIGQEQARRDEDFDQLLSTLGNRLGFDRVRKFVPKDSHTPELEYASLEAVYAEKQDWGAVTRERPFRAFARPERLRTLTPGRPPRRFEWRRNAFDTIAAAGPERLTPDWWRPHNKKLRDYWTVQTGQGPKLWLLTHPAVIPPEWFIAGRFL